jgi:hypothetical protein
MSYENAKVHKMVELTMKSFEGATEPWQRELDILEPFAFGVGLALDASCKEYAEARRQIRELVKTKAADAAGKEMQT